MKKKYKKKTFGMASDESRPIKFFELWSGMTTWRSIDASFLPSASGTERASALLGGIIFSISDIALGELLH